MQELTDMQNLSGGNVSALFILIIFAGIWVLKWYFRWLLFQNVWLWNRKLKAERNQSRYHQLPSDRSFQRPTREQRRERYLREAREAAQGVWDG